MAPLAQEATQERTRYITSNRMLGHKGRTRQQWRNGEGGERVVHQNPKFEHQNKTTST